MSADIQIVSVPNLEKIESFLKDASYRETIEYSASFNTRLCIERRLRLPFLDPQTGVAQNHSQLFVDERHRMPGFRQGQIYTYPAPRWRKSRRQYLIKKFPDRPFQALRKETEVLPISTNNTILTACSASPTVIGSNINEPDFNGSLLEESSSLGAAGGDTSDSKDSQQQPQHLKDDLPKEWFFDDMDMNDVDSLEEPKSPADDEYDYDPRYGSKKRRKRRPSKRASLTPGEGGPGRRRSGAGRGRTSTATADTSLVGLDAIDGVGLDVSTTPTTSGRRPRGTRGRRRTKPKTSGGNACDPPSPGLNSEPPSFESAAAAVGVSDMPVAEEHSDLRNYRKYL
ncbi:zinc finger protein DPF3 [Teleopsis dalmanni]|uniref:zinc finger protein DPF3 n=1 Tax=Teleopsis dalmanni TaxID=139649 RepID=UPI0018CEAE1C|nr:zinc finger protein DPF3 [Teleopsis dalmanni]